ncbi:unnamed protein product [Brachionus calyciflorus]|uniref:Hexosyltransferase n=1 Tax=Brachionus calyciflorus TaxID=104777 RepID=A0A813WB10_9BILA|nr:unnamed protein product [Brachionus calyciflorus]
MNNGKNLTMISLVTLSPDNFLKRYLIRKTWSNSVLFKSTRSVFLLGLSLNETINNMVMQESKNYGDIIQEDFIDTYYNLTIKTIMGLKWVSKYCSNSQFTLKIDDDAVVNTPVLIEYLKNITYNTSNKNLYMGNYLEKPEVYRNENSKWYLSYDEYNETYFPPYHTGTAYILSTDLVRELFEISLSTKVFRFEDVYIGMLVRKIKVDIVNLASFIEFDFDWFLSGTSKDCSKKIFYYAYDSYDFLAIWKKLRSEDFFDNLLI